MQVDYLMVGSGLTGSVIARILTDAGRKVLVVERRCHGGGNVHDYVHASGIRIHTYGPHYFRTDSDRVWEFVNRFATFDRYEAILKSYVDGRYENWPVAGSYIRRVIGEHWEADFNGTPANFEEAALALMPRVVYEKFVKGYTEKQWGVPARTLSADLVKRFDVHEDDDPRLKKHKYQGIPSEGYASFMRSLLAGIPVLLNFDYHKNRDAIKAKRLLVFTGSIDEFFGFDLGPLAYRSQRREHEYHPDAEYLLPCGQVNNPDTANGTHIRTIEWKHMMPRRYAESIRGAVLTKEFSFTPTNPDSYEYPFPNESNARLYGRYRERADTLPDLLVCGRLGEYRYYDMDEAIERAMVLAEKIILIRR